MLEEIEIFFVQFLHYLFIRSYMKRAIILVGILLVGFVTYQSLFVKKKSTSIQQEMRIAIQGDPSSFDPRSVIDVQSQCMLIPLFEGLMRLDNQGTLQNAIADSYTINEDQTVYIFQLKRTSWSNGDPVTAHNFEKAWKRIVSPEFPTKAIFFFNVIKNAERAKKGDCPIDEIGVSALDDYTLQITLEHPAAYFLELLTAPCFAPAHDGNESFFSSHTSSQPLISNGAFYFQSWSPNHSIVFKKNNNYWDQTNVTLNTLTFSIISDASTALHLFEQGKIDYMDNSSIPIESIPSLKNKKILQTIDALKMEWLFVNVTAFPVNNLNFRKALSLSINRPYISKYFYHNGETPASNILPKQLQLLDTVQEEFSPEPAKALLQKAMEEMGLTLNTLPQIVLKGRPITQDMQLMQVLQEQWKKYLGLDIKIEILDHKLLLEDVTTQKFQIGLLGWASFFNDPIYNLNSLNSQVSFTGWKNEDYARIIDLSNRTIDVLERRELLKQATLLTQEEMPIIPLFDSPSYFVLNSRVNDLTFNAFGKPIFTYAKTTKKS